MTETGNISDSCRLAELFKVFGDETRIRILTALLDGEMYVYDIVSRTGVSQSAVSHQLKLLKYANLVTSRREGRLISYALADEHVRTIISMGLDHVNE